MDDILIDSIKAQISVKCITNEDYLLNIIKNENNIQDILIFIYYIINCYLLKYKDLELNSNEEMNIKKNMLYSELLKSCDIGLSSVIIERKLFLKWKLCSIF